MTRTHACTYNQRDTYACIMTKERTRVRRANRTGAETERERERDKRGTGEGKGEEGERNLFLRPQRRRLVSSRPCLLLLFSWEGRVTERVRGRTRKKKVRIKTRSTGVKRRRTHANFICGCARLRTQPGHSIFVTNPLLHAREISRDFVGLE